MSMVMRGLDLRIHLLTKKMDCRVKPGNDGERKRMKKALLALALTGGVAPPTLGQEDVAAFYKGRTIRLVVGIGVGSGYDINARLLARHMSAHVPGHPTSIVQNQSGAGSL